MAKKPNIEHFDPGATFPEGVSYEGIRASILAGSDAHCPPLPPADPPKRVWNSERGVWEINGVEVPPDPTAASVEYDTPVSPPANEPSLQGLPTLGSPVPPPTRGPSILLLTMALAAAAALGFGAMMLWLLL